MDRLPRKGDIVCWYAANSWILVLADLPPFGGPVKLRMMSGLRLRDNEVINFAFYQAEQDLWILIAEADQLSE